MHILDMVGEVGRSVVAKAGVDTPVVIQTNRTVYVLGRMNDPTSPAPLMEVSGDLLSLIGNPIIDISLWRDQEGLKVYRFTTRAGYVIFKFSGSPLLMKKVAGGRWNLVSTNEAHPTRPTVVPTKPAVVPDRRLILRKRK